MYSYVSCVESTSSNQWAGFSAGPLEISTNQSSFTITDPAPKDKG